MRPKQSLYTFGYKFSSLLQHANSAEVHHKKQTKLGLLSLLHKLQDVNQRAPTRRCLPVIVNKYQAGIYKGIRGGLIP